MKQMFFILSNLQTHYHSKLGLKKWTNIEDVSGKSTAPNTTRTRLYVAKSGTPQEYPVKESKHDKKESEPGIIVNQQSLEVVIGHPRGWTRKY